MLRLSSFKNALSFSLYFVCEWLFCFLVLLPLLANQWALFVPFVLLAITHGFMLFILRKSQSSSLAGFLIVSAIIGFLALLFLHLSLFAATLLVALLTFFSLRRDEGNNPERLWRLVLVFASVVVFYALFAPISHPSGLFLLLLAELAAAVLWISLGNHLNSRWLAMISIFLIAAVAIMSFLTDIVKPLIVMIYDMLFNFVLRPITYGVASVIFGWLNHLSSPKTGRRIHNALQGSNAVKKHAVGAPMDVHPMFNFGLLFGILITVIFFAIAFWQLRKIRTGHDRVRTKTETMVSEVSSSHPGFHPERRSQRLFAPKHPVRRAIFQLQKRAAKHRLGRYASESLTEWLERLNISQLDVLIGSYEKVRYGGQELTDSENAAFHKAIKEAEQQVTTRVNQRNNTQQDEV